MSESEREKFVAALDAIYEAFEGMDADKVEAGDPEEVKRAAGAIRKVREILWRVQCDTQRDADW